MGFEPITFRSWSSCPKPTQMSSILTILLLHTIIWTLIGSTVEQLLNNRNFTWENTGADLEGRRTRREPPLFFAEIGCLTLCGCPRQRECTKSCELNLKITIFLCFWGGTSSSDHPLFPQVLKLYLSLIWAPPLLKNPGSAPVGPLCFAGKVTSNSPEIRRSTPPQTLLRSLSIHLF